MRILFQLFLTLLIVYFVRATTSPGPNQVADQYQHLIKLIASSNEKQGLHGYREAMKENIAREEHGFNTFKEKLRSVRSGKFDRKKYDRKKSDISVAVIKREIAELEIQMHVDVLNKIWGKKIPRKKQYTCNFRSAIILLCYIIHEGCGRDSREIYWKFSQVSIHRRYRKVWHTCTARIPVHTYCTDEDVHCAPIHASEMEFYVIFLCCLCAGTALAQGEAGTYEFKFRTCSYVKEANNKTVIPEEKFHLCRLPVEERANICKTALKEEFPEYQRIEYRDDVAWGEERLYEVFLNGVFYRGKRPPFIVSACMCPTAPPMYMKDGTDGTYAKFYTDLHVGEDEFGFTKPWKKDVSFGTMFNWDE